MQKADYIYMIIDNLLVYGINLPSDLQSDKIFEHFNQFDVKVLKIVAGFNRLFLEHFLIVSKGKTQKDLGSLLDKMELISMMISPVGNLNYLSETQVEFILTKIDSLSMREISEANISKIADEQLQKEFGGGNAGSQALDNQIASAAFYLINQGYTQAEIEEKILEVKQDPSKLDGLFSLQQKDIYSLPPELQQGIETPRGSRSQDITIVSSQEIQDAIDHHIESTQQEITGEKAQKVNEIFQLIKEHVREHMNNQYERVYIQIHPDRLKLALKLLRQTKRKSKRMPLLIEWFFCSHLLSLIELKVEHWQVSTQATRGQAGVYTAGIDFSRYDKIVAEFKDPKLAKVINISRRILQTPTKQAIQKLGQSLISETGFDEHLYFTD
jgi:hypothetical protein